MLEWVDTSRNMADHLRKQLGLVALSQHTDYIIGHVTNVLRPTNPSILLQLPLGLSLLWLVYLVWHEATSFISSISRHIA